MIEIICNGDDENKSESTKTTKSTVIRRPKNIKQIGDVSSDRKIYIEDYAFTYINSIAYNSPDEEQAGVLLGECQNSDDERCLFIKGVIKARPVDDNDGRGIYFDENVWNGIYSDIEKYFPNLQVVGWFAAMPNITAERMQYLKRIHLDNFAGNMKTMYLINTIEKEEYFYLYENGDLKRQKGYVCFYERNYEMQEYMLEKRGNKTNEPNSQDKVMKSIRTIIQEKEEIKQQKRNASFTYGISAFMVVVVLVIGINLMNSYEKMKNLDQSMNNIIDQISNIGDGGKNNNDVPVNANVETTAADVVSVTKLNGDVYPTEEPTTSAGAETPTETPAVTQAETQAPTYHTYVVKSGDTIMSICKSYYGNASKYNEVIALNALEDADKLYVGQEIKLP